MLKRFSSALILFLIIFVSGCAGKVPEGYKTVREAKERYEKLQSARVIMTDMSSDEIIMDFSFYINSSREMVFSYSGTDGESNQYAYSNGAEYFYKESEDDKWHVIGSSDKDYLYNIYNEEYRYPYARAGIFFLDAGAVETADVNMNEDGSAVISYTYNAEKLSEDTENSLDGVSGFNSLTTVFHIDSDGYIAEFEEIGSVIDENGDETEVNIKISVTEINRIFDIPYPVDEIADD